MNVEQLGLIDHPPTPEEVRRQMRAYLVRYVVLVAGISLVIGGLIGRLTVQDPAALTPAAGWQSGPSFSEGGASSRPVSSSLQIYVSGAVVMPQVVEVPAGSILADALAAAGGPAPEADLEGLNLAAPLADHQHVLIPTRVPPPTATPQPAPATPAPTSGAVSPEAQVNLNTATLAELLTLPGIGETRAQAILAYRAEHGPFTRIEELQNVSGIGPATYEKLAPYITIGP
ncbi:MAG TPA: helix-hairpin-helix domain-containing protein [Anaerolineae bacterium]|nr:MAG: ComE operon protein 1 [Chloroflexi bacterium ADurb.Bin222]HOC20924.1 helix-hairpin-helix domain-containing protein [Anaerolineae bacterium]HQM13617.1 helix-hairpin-helix domain-containing protein [Anaerolineae bacterium]